MTGARAAAPGVPSAVTVALLVGAAAGLGRMLPDGGGGSALDGVMTGFAAGMAAGALTLALFALLDRPRPLAAQIAHPRRAALAAGIAMLLARTPVFLAVFPGLFDYDVGPEWLSQTQQIATGELNAHHPVIHTLFLKVTIGAGEALFGSYEAGVATSVAAQAVLTAGLLATALHHLMRAGIGRRGAALACAFWALDPVISLYVFATTKDVLFSALVVVLCAIVLAAGRTGRLGPRDAAAASLLTFLIVCLRTNALIALVFACPAAVALVPPAVRRALGASFAAAMAAALVFLGPVSAAAGVAASPVGVWNALAVPMQQVAHVAMRPDTPAGERAAIERALPGLAYAPGLSDAARYAFMHAPVSRRELARLYLDLGRAHPIAYAKALLLHTEDAWSPFAVIDAHTRGTGKTEVVEFEPKDPVRAHPLAPGLREVLRVVAEEPGFERLPVLGALVSIPAHLLVLMLALLRARATRDRTGLAALMPLAWLALSNLFGPCMIIRYFLPLFQGLPLVAMILVRGGEALAHREGEAAGGRAESA